MQLTLLTLLILLGSYILDRFLFNSYDVNSFFVALNEYKKLYIEGGAGNMFNSSLHVFVKLVFPEKYYLFAMAALSSACLLMALRVLICNENMVVKSYVAGSLYMLLTPVFATYHLIVFCAPIIIFYNLKKCIIDEIVIKICLFSSVLLVSPKFGFIIKGFSVDALINPLIAIITLSLLFKSTITPALRGGNLDSN